MPEKTLSSLGTAVTWPSLTGDENQALLLLLLAGQSRVSRPSHQWVTSRFPPAPPQDRRVRQVPLCPLTPGHSLVPQAPSLPPYLPPVGQDEVHLTPFRARSTSI